MSNTDTRELRAFKQKIDKLNTSPEGMEKFFGWATRQIGARFLQRVIPKTPAENSETFQYRTIGGRINTKVIRGGALRDGWTGGKKISSGSEYAYLQRKPVKRMGSEYELEIENSKEYASYVEYGHSQRPGRFVPYIGKTVNGVRTGAQLVRARVPGQRMMETSALEIEAMAPGLAEKLTQEYFSKNF